MSTTLNIDDQTLKNALQVSPGMNKVQVINEALRGYTRRKQRLALLDLRGKISWEGDIDNLRKRT